MASDTYGAILLTTANDVGAMLQKKMATPSETYAPAVWAKTINLLGKLPEATVSGSIATLEDGADAVPCKNVVATIAPNLDGVSKITGIQIPSRNMASISDADFTLNSVHYYTENGVLYIDGTSTSETSSNNNAFKVLDFWLPSGTYYFSRGDTLISLNVPAYLRKYDDKTEVKVNQGSFTLSEKTHLYIGLYVYQKSFSNIKAKICINLGSTAITYEDTAPMTTYTAQLGRTVHGGTADLVTGEGVDENGNDYTFSGQEIDTLLGVNNFWHDAGNTSVTYRRDIDLALQALSGSRGLMMARPPAAAETEETEPEDETTETIEETPEDMEK